MKLTEVKEGKKVRILELTGDTALGSKLRQLGLVPDDQICIVRKAPFGGPLLLEIDGREVALGRAIVEKILVEVLG